MTEGTRSRWPWLLWGVIVALVVPTIVLAVRNGSVSDDPYFIPLAIMMILGYSTVGALLVSRTSGTPIPWLLMTIGAMFLLTGLSDEYTRYTYETAPGALPFGHVSALISSLFWVPVIGAITLVVLLFPDGRVPGPRWRFLPVAIVGGIVTLLLGALLTPGRIDEVGVDVAIRNPLGIEALRDVAPVLVGIGALVVMLSVLPTIAAVVLRFRRSRGEERQQLRWLAYVVTLIFALILLDIATAIVLGPGSEENVVANALFLVTFASIGIGIPVATGVAVLRYRLYDLDVVVKKTVVFGVLVVLLMVVSLGTLLALSSPLTDLAPDETFAVGVTGAIVGASVWPLWRLARRIADRVVYGGRATPYEVLTEFSDRVGGTYSTEDVLPRMAQLLAEATGASVARVWLRVGSELRPAATWPEGADRVEPLMGRRDELPDVGALGENAVEVRHQGELLGALSVRMPPNDPMGAGRERIVRDLAAQAGLVLRNVRLIEELRESRRRIVAAQDDRRKELERDIHDGAQQQLVALAVKARLVGSVVSKDAAKAEEMLVDLQRDLTGALENLRDLARGIYPPLLADKGLAAALESQARKAPMSVTVESDGDRRYPQDVESAVYFACLEALNNVAKYADATGASVTLDERDGALRFTVTDDGRGFDTAATSYGTGLQGIADRLDAIGGRLEVRSAPGVGTTIIGHIDRGEAGA